MRLDTDTDQRKCDILILLLEIDNSPSKILMKRCILKNWLFQLWESVRPFWYMYVLIRDTPLNKNIRV